MPPEIPIAPLLWISDLYSGDWYDEDKANSFPCEYDAGDDDAVCVAGVWDRSWQRDWWQCYSCEPQRILCVQCKKKAAIAGSCDAIGSQYEDWRRTPCKYTTGAVPDDLCTRCNDAIDLGSSWVRYSCEVTLCGTCQTAAEAAGHCGALGGWESLPSWGVLHTRFSAWSQPEDALNEAPDDNVPLQQQDDLHRWSCWAKHIQDMADLASKGTDSAADDDLGGLDF